MADRSPATDDNFDLLLFLWARRRLILGVTLLGMVAGIAAAFIIRPRFKSEVILFPAITNSVSKALLSEVSTGRDDILALGDEQDAEQLLQILHSDRVRDHITEKYHLADVYRIEADNPHIRTELRESYEEHFKFEYTKFGSVRVEVLDEDAQRAADMANDVAALVDTVWKAMGQERAGKGLAVVAENVHRIEKELIVVEDSMRVLRRLGVHDYHTQSERYNEYMGAAIVKGDMRAVKEFEERFKVLAEYGGPYTALQDRFYNEMKRLTTLRMKMDQARADMESDLPHKFVVNRAQPADKKSYPVRWLVVVVSTISAFLLALLLIVVQENIKKITDRHAR
ncbi:MAG: hypothetical protein IPL77_15775 [Flavobacteriales bacterium]|jgi:uncharacterized protein involved in exopolysaccharide biosynthesis|nr:hypothetical protein [Flavobacteriales bacterium]